ncbi:MAG: alpha/beta hydrolase [Clostridia bacterium]|nr:alpha/beta hydrolase [Clostridia bacterium]
MSLQTRIDSYMWSKSDRKRDLGLTTPTDVERFDNIEFADGLLMDLYRPRVSTDSFPVIVNVHGGGWFYGNKEVYQYYCMRLAQHGYAVVNFNYRLAPRYKFPAQLEDTNAALTWVVEHSAEYGLDTNKICVVGDSAGAQIAGIYVCMLTDTKYRNRIISEYGGKINFPANLMIRVMGMNCGVYDVRDERFTRVFIKKTHNMDKAASDAAVLEHVTKAFPPCFIMSGNNDFLLQDAHKLGKKLDELGVCNTVKIYGDDSHKVYHDFQCNIRDDIGSKADEDEMRFFENVLSGIKG